MEAAADLKAGLRALGQAIDLIASGLPADADFWAQRKAGLETRSTELRRKTKLDRHRARALGDGLERPAPRGADLAAVNAAAEAMDAVPKGERGSPAKRAALGVAIRDIGARLDAAHEARCAAMRLDQTVQLEAARESVPTNQVLERKRGVRQARLRTRDGLVMQYESGGLGPIRAEKDRLLAIALRYRDRYEMASPTLKSCLAVNDGVAAREKRTLLTEVSAAHRRAALSGMLRRWDALVSTRLGEDPLLALRAVAGEGRSINSITTARRRRRRLAAGLKAALTLIADQVANGA